MMTKGRKPRAAKKKINTRVDFTPMVDMMMLLLTFFMFCTTLSRPQIMDIAMPTKDNIEDVPNTPRSRAITFLLAENNKIYYYEGDPNYEDYASLKETSYIDVRNVIAEKNRAIVKQVNELNKQKKAKQISDAKYADAVKEAKRDKKGAIAIIKATEGAVYQNLIDILDEMAICSVGQYSVLDLTDGDDFMLKNYESKGIYAQAHEM